MLVVLCINQRNLIQRLRRNVWPSFGPLSTLGLTLRTFQQESEMGDCSQYSIQDGLLYFHDPKPAHGIHPLKSLKLYAPASLRSTLLRYYHDHPTAGHLGITKTFFWPKMASEVKKYVTSCTVCQLTKPSQRKTCWSNGPNSAPKTLGVCWGGFRWPFATYSQWKFFLSIIFQSGSRSWQ